jgi:AcrR family transcriptional regulator
MLSIRECYYISVPNDVKTGGGQARTRLARRAVIGAARSLFSSRGYAATTIDAISEAADVPAATVYRLFGSKLGILKAMLDVSIGGDEQPVAVQERPGVLALLAEPDPARLLAGFATITAAINGRSHEVYRVLESAAGSDPAAAALLADLQRQGDHGQGQLARTLARKRKLRKGLREGDAADVIHALMSPEVFRLLVVDRGWSSQRYEEWLAITLAGQLL